MAYQRNSALAYQLFFNLAATISTGWQMAWSANPSL